MKIQVPKKIKIGTFEAEIRLIPDLKLDDGYRGYYNQRTGILGLEPKCGRMKDRVFLHEIVHMIDLNYECGISEENVSRIANGLTEFLEDNLSIELDWSLLEEESDESTNRSTD